MRKVLFVSAMLVILAVATVLVYMYVTPKELIRVAGAEDMVSVDTESGMLSGKTYTVSYTNRNYSRDYEVRQYVFGGSGEVDSFAEAFLTGLGDMISNRTSVQISGVDGEVFGVIGVSTGQMMGYGVLLKDGNTMLLRTVRTGKSCSR